MSSDETNSPLEAMSAAVRAATKLGSDVDKSDESEGKLTPEMLASAIKLASLTANHQEELTPATVNAAIRIAKKPAHNQEQQKLTPESLAMALKLATKTSQSASSDDKNKDEGDVSANQMLAAMKAAVAMTQETQTHEPVTSELLAGALKLAKK
jgi:hypothetical protein